MRQAQNCEGSMCLESSGKPDAGKLARPVWGWGRGATPRPTPPAGPAEIARTRIDFSDWLDTLKRRDRRIAVALAAGNRTSNVSKRFKVKSFLQKKSLKKTYCVKK